jgi:hypothetical protein
MPAALRDRYARSGVLDALVGEKGLLEMLKKRQEYRTLEQSLVDVRAENARLREEARRLQEDPSAAEEIDAIEQQIRAAINEGKTLAEARKQLGYHQLQTRRK